MLGAFGVVHLADALLLRADDGPASAGVALGVASAVLGLALVWLGARVSLEGRLRWWRLLALPALAVGVFWSVLPTGLALFATRPFGEHEPTAVSVRLEATDTEDVQLTTADGFRLAATYVPSQNGAAVLLLHGAASTRAAVVPHADALVRHGFGVLLLDTRGHGGSEGRVMDFGWYGDADIDAAIDWLSLRPDVRDGRIGVLGLSMGGEQALTAAASDARIRAVVAEGATHRVYEDIRPLLGGMEIVLGVPQYRALYGLSDLLSPASPPRPLEDAVAAVAPRPVLLLATESESRYSRRQQARAPGSTRLWAPASEGHTKALAEDPAEWERRVVAGFLRSELGE